MATASKNKKRIYKTYVIERRALDVKLTELAEEGYTLFALYPAINVAGAFDAITYKEE